MDSHLDGRTGPQSYVEALPTIQGNLNKGLIIPPWGLGEEGQCKEKITIALPFVYHLKTEVGNILDNKNKESTKYSNHVLELG